MRLAIHARGQKIQCSSSSARSLAPQRAIRTTVKEVGWCKSFIPISSSLPLNRLLTLPKPLFRPLGLSILERDRLSRCRNSNPGRFHFRKTFGGPNGRNTISRWRFVSTYSSDCSEQFEASQRLIILGCSFPTARAVQQR